MLTKNQLAPRLSTQTINGENVDLSGYRGKKVLIKFHRFSGCPVARFQVNEFIGRQKELNIAGIETIIFLHSSVNKVQSNFKEVPGLHIIADKQKIFYQLFQSEFSWKALFLIDSWRSTFTSVFQGYFPHFNKFEGGITGIPSDFLVDEQGKIVDLNYGKHFGDTWSVSEVLNKLQLN
jgi:peroxiredoxin